jgi:hypothetical protein
MPAAMGIPPETSGKAIASLVFGLLAFILPAAILAIVFGHISRAEIRQSAGRLTGDGMALAGLIFGYMGVSVIPILIIAAIAIPNLLRARIAANEASAVGAVRTLNIAELSYVSEYKVGYTCNLHDLGGAGGSRTAAGLIDNTLASGEKNGYIFQLQNCTADGYAASAVPRPPNQTGMRTFCSKQDGVIRTGNRSAEDCLNNGEPLH